MPCSACLRKPALCPLEVNVRHSLDCPGMFIWLFVLPPFNLEVPEFRGHCTLYMYFLKILGGWLHFIFERKFELNECQSV